LAVFSVGFGDLLHLDADIGHDRNDVTAVGDLTRDTDSVWEEREGKEKKEERKRNYL
jgi:hypothetical protein